MTAVLTPEQIEQFNTEGYVTPVRIMDAAEAGTLRAKLEATEAARGGKLAPTERSKAHMLFKWLDDLIRDPRVLDPIEQLIGPNILCWNTLFWIKEAQSPSFVSWHQDTKYWGLSSEKVITAWLALSPASLDAGCMRVMPRTHIGDVLPHDDQYHQDNLLTRGQQITEGVDDAEAIYMPLQVGEMSLHNYRLAHASGPNNTDDRRIGVSMHFMPTETGQIVGNWDSAALVRGEDTFGNFTHTPIPAADFDEEAVAFHAKAAQAINEIVYAGADENTAKL
ncbi:MAG: phytanoyl-CoA dioxygenase family protein [Pseudomonadota bacterium]|nr:phytanoyl-CoA dioxygenase family protein [Pseudomonadota bacterium]MED5358801.1 phytanoyl-CoA dioxygenase family protein [Pseudomonadota bacterium]